MDVKSIMNSVFQKKNVTPIAVFILIIFMRRDFLLAALVAAVVVGLRFFGF